MFTTEEKKILGIAVIGLLIGIAAYSLAGTSTGGGNVFYNNTTSYAGSSITFYLHNDTVTGIAYTSKVMNRTITPTSPERNITYLNLPNGNTFLGNWTSDGINVHLIPSGAHQFHADAYKTGKGGTHVIRLFFKCYMIDPLGNAHLHGTSELSTEILAGAETEADMDFISMDINTNLTDRMHIEVWANQTGVGNLPDLILEFDDLTDSRLIIPATQQEITGLFNQKVNKTGDNMTGDLNKLSLENNSIYTNKIRTYYNSTGYLKPNNDDIYTVILNSGNTNYANNLISFNHINNSGTNYFLGRYASGNYNPENHTAYPNYPLKNRIMMRFGASGWVDDSDGWGGTAGTMDISTNATWGWTNTSSPTEIHFFTTPNGSLTSVKRATLTSEGKIILYDLIGVGDRSVCVHADGTLFAC